MENLASIAFDGLRLISCGSNSIEIGIAVHCHQQVGFGQNAVENMRRPFGAADRQTIGVGATYADGSCSECYGLDHIATGTDAAVE